MQYILNSLTIVYQLMLILFYMYKINVDVQNYYDANDSKVSNTHNSYLHSYILYFSIQLDC